MAPMLQMTFGSHAERPGIQLSAIWTDAYMCCSLDSLKGVGWDEIGDYYRDLGGYWEFRFQLIWSGCPNQARSRTNRHPFDPLGSWSRMPKSFLARSKSRSTISFDPNANRYSRTCRGETYMKHLRLFFKVLWALIRKFHTILSKGGGGRHAARLPEETGTNRSLCVKVALIPNNQKEHVPNSL